MLSSDCLRFLLGVAAIEFWKRGAQLAYTQRLWPTKILYSSHKPLEWFSIVHCCSQATPFFAHRGTIATFTQIWNCEFELKREMSLKRNNHSLIIHKYVEGDEDTLPVLFDYLKIIIFTWKGCTKWTTKLDEKKVDPVSVKFSLTEPLSILLRGIPYNAQWWLAIHNEFVRTINRNTEFYQGKRSGTNELNRILSNIN